MDYLILLTKGSYTEFINSTSQLIGITGTLFGVVKSLSNVTDKRIQQMKLESGPEEACNYLRINQSIALGATFLCCSYLLQLFTIYIDDRNIYIFILPIILTIVIIIVLYLLQLWLYDKHRKRLNLSSSIFHCQTSTPNPQTLVCPLLPASKNDKMVLQERTVQPVEEILKQLLEGQKQIIQRMAKLDSEVTNMKFDITAIKSEMATKNQQNENSDYIKSLLHCTEEISAQFEGLLHTTVTKEAIATLASKEDINKLNAKFEVLNSRLFHQEAELYELKAVK